MEIQSKHGGANVRVPPPLVYVALILLGVALDSFWPIETLFGPLLRWALAILPSVAGLGLIAWAVGFFRKTGQRPEPWLPSPSMIIEGPYRYTRNPMYVGMTLMQLGIGSALGNVWVVILAAPALIIVHFTAVLPEEAYLAEKFGAPYVEFKTKVRRY